MEIRRIHRDEIEKPKYNGCVHYAPNGNIFGYMWFLDFVAKDWEVLVEGDYQSVFPLIWRKGVIRGRELYQPPLMRELGIYSVNALSTARIQAFLDAIPEEYLKVDIHLNERNRPPQNSGFEVSEKANYQMLLNEPYEVLTTRYSNVVQTELSKAEEAGLYPGSGIKPEVIADFYQKYALDRRHLDRNFHALQRIMYNVLHRGWGFASSVMDANHELCAVNFYIFSNGKMLSLTPVVSPSGREQGAYAFMTDMIIRANANRPLVFDFNEAEGYLSPTDFGAAANNYYQVKRDKRILGFI